MRDKHKKGELGQRGQPVIDHVKDAALSSGTYGVEAFEEETRHRLLTKEWIFSSSMFSVG